jgi:hypothetical protein
MNEDDAQVHLTRNNNSKKELQSQNFIQLSSCSLLAQNASCLFASLADRRFFFCRLVNKIYDDVVHHVVEKNYKEFF